MRRSRYAVGSNQYVRKELSRRFGNDHAAMADVLLVINTPNRIPFTAEQEQFYASLGDSPASEHKASNPSSRREVSIESARAWLFS